MSQPKLAEVIQFLEHTFPADTAADWDSVGLVVGSPEAEITSALLVVDVTEATVQQAIDLNVSLIVAHHPLLLSGVDSVAQTTAKGRLITELIKHDIALFTIHTNADSARPGVSDALGECIGLEIIEGTELEVGTGIGRIGALRSPMSAQAFANQIAAALPRTTNPVLLAGDPTKSITRVAICGGAGDSFLDAVALLNVDAYVTSDLRHHKASEFIADNDCVLINVSHWAGEWPWLRALAKLFADTYADKVKVIVSDISTDPWSESAVRSSDVSES
ncbi:MAG: Nif3-like dinuclear metal center hexameric protein [Actinomycetales bacterium]|nr:Nif3-like dinuclear metal center hexameric protein [Actinomycetales bacterium]